MRNNVDITFHPSWWNKYAGIEFDEKFWFNTDYRLEADTHMRRVLYEYFADYGIGEKEPAPRPILGSDLLACGFLHSQLLGCNVLFKKDDAPQVLPAKLSDAQIGDLRVPDLDIHPIWKRMQDQIDEFMQKFGYVDSAINLMGIQNVALDLWGEDLFIDYYDEESDLSKHLLDVITDLTIDVGKRLYSVSRAVSGGVTSVINKVCPTVYLTSNCSVTMISNDLYCEHLLPYDIKLANAFSDFGIHHCGNNMENVIDGYLMVPNLKFFEIGAGSNLSYISNAIDMSGRDIVSCIRYSPVSLKTDTLSEIKHKTDDAIKAFGTDKKLCFSCVGIDKDVSPDKVIDYLNVVTEI